MKKNSNYAYKRLTLALETHTVREREWKKIFQENGIKRKKKGSEAIFTSGKNNRP